MNIENEKNVFPGYLIFLLLAVIIPFIHVIYFVAVSVLLIFIFKFMQTRMDVSGLLGISASILAMAALSFVMDFTGYEFPMYIVGAAISMTCVGGAAAMYIRLHGERKYGLDDRSLSATPSVALVMMGALSAIVTAYWIIGWMDVHVTFSQLFFLTVIGAVAGALLESIPSRMDRNITLVLGTCMVMWLFASFGYYVNFEHLSAAFIFSLFLAFLAYRLDVADVSAMLSATLLGILIIVFTNINWYIILIAFFLLGGAFTRYKYDYKVAQGIAQSKGGVRSYVNVLSNSLAALVLALGFGIYHPHLPQFSYMLLFAYLGAVATATGDTLASEIGETYKGKHILITTFEPVNAGTDGAISKLGEAVCLGGSLVIGILALLLGVVDLTPSGGSDYLIWLLIIVLGGFTGTNFDSLLGATLQQRGWLSNSGVNLIATVGGAFMSGTAYYVLSGHVV